MRFCAFWFFLLPVFSAAACSSGDAPKPVKHDCSGVSAGSTSCFCDAFRTGDDAPSKSGTCSEAAIPGSLCCADPDWPGTTDEATLPSCACIVTTETTCPGGYANADPGATMHVTSCDFGGAASGGGGTDSGTTTKCTDTGYCSIDGDNCTCGTECIHYGPGEYMCGFDCASGSDCAGKVDPPSGDALTSCNPGLQTDTAVYDGYCVRP